MKLSIEERAILSHIVINPENWTDHAIRTIGEWAVLAKIDRWRADYLAKKDLSGYQTRAEREAP